MFIVNRVYSKLLIKYVFTFSGSNRVSNNWQSGDHVEFLYGSSVDNIFVRKIKLYEEFKNVLDQLKKENRKVQFSVNYIISKTKKN